MASYSDQERLTAEEYISFLKRSDLGSQYPRQRFRERITRLLANVDVTITARDMGGDLVGVCLGLTDFVYFLYVTDLGVARDYVRQGIGSELLRRAHLAAGGEEDICLIAWSHPSAIEFYKKNGVRPDASLVGRECTEWEEFVVSDETVLPESGAAAQGALPSPGRP